MREVLLVGLLLVASLCDLRQRRVPNLLILVGSLTAVGLALSPWAVLSPLMALFGGLVGLLLFLPPYALGLMGAGDVKLLGMCGLFLGPVLVLQGALYAMLAGGLLAIVYGVWRKSTDGNPVTTLPYAVAIAFGISLLLAGL